jgi:hypothetical protein
MIRRLKIVHQFTVNSSNKSPHKPYWLDWHVNLVILFGVVGLLCYSNSNTTGGTTT